MSDQDFFFDDEDAPAAKEPSAAASAPGKSGSGDRTAPDKSASGKQATRSSATPVTPAGGQFFEQNVAMPVAALLMVIALLIGMIIGIFVGKAISGSAVPVTTSSGSTTPPSASPSPLTSEQMQGGLPSGHPDIGAAGNATSETPAP